MPKVENSKSVKSPSKDNSSITMKTKRTTKKNVESNDQVSTNSVEDVVKPVKVSKSKKVVDEPVEESVDKPVKKVSKSKKVVDEPVDEPVKKVSKSKKVVEEKVDSVEPVKKMSKSKKVAESVDEPVKKKSTKKEKDPNAPKKELNPIMKEMNRFRNEVIGPIVGSKAPKITIPPFKLALADARTEMKLDEKDKNTVEVVQCAISLFEKDTSKYV